MKLHLGVSFTPLHSGAGLYRGKGPAVQLGGIPYVLLGLVGPNVGFWSFFLECGVITGFHVRWSEILIGGVSQLSAWGGGSNPFSIGQGRGVGTNPGGVAWAPGKPTVEVG